MFFKSLFLVAFLLTTTTVSADDEVVVNYDALDGINVDYDALDYLDYSPLPKQNRVVLKKPGMVNIGKSNSKQVNVMKKVDKTKSTKKKKTKAPVKKAATEPVSKKTEIVKTEFDATKVSFEPTKIINDTNDKTSLKTEMPVVETVAEVITKVKETITDEASKNGKEKEVVSEVVAVSDTMTVSEVVKSEPVVKTNTDKDTKTIVAETKETKIDEKILATNSNKSVGENINQKYLVIDFPNNSTTLTDADNNRLRLFFSKYDGKSKVKIVSFATGLNGSQESAKRTSLKRALVVRSALIKFGVKSNLIEVRAQGQSTNPEKADSVEITCID